MIDIPPIINHSTPPQAGGVFKKKQKSPVREKRARTKWQMPLGCKRRKEILGGAIQ